MYAKNIATHCVVAIESRLQHFNGAEIIRYESNEWNDEKLVGFKIGDKEFVIEINVKEV